jgi:hypothetical protein
MTIISLACSSLLCQAPLPVSTWYLVFGPKEAQGDEFAMNWRSIFARNFLYTVGASRIIAADVAYTPHSERRCCRHRYQLRRRHG